MSTNKLNISISDWEEINTELRKLYNLRNKVSTKIFEVMTKFENSDKECELLLALQRKIDYDIPVYFTTVQTEWTGGDSSNPENFKKNEPHIVDQFLNYGKI